MGLGRNISVMEGVSRAALSLEGAWVLSAGVGFIYGE